MKVGVTFKDGVVIDYDIDNNIIDIVAMSESDINFNNNINDNIIMFNKINDRLDNILI